MLRSTKQQRVRASTIAAKIRRRSSLETSIRASVELLEKAFAATGADLQVTYDGRVRFVRPWELRRGDLMESRCDCGSRLIVGCRVE